MATLSKNLTFGKSQAGGQIINIEFEIKGQERHMRKADARPFGGWPGGVDPYPDLMDQDVIATAVYNQQITGWVDVVGDIRLRDKLEIANLPGAEVFVDRIQQTGWGFRAHFSGYAKPITSPPPSV